jgi:glycosyltransferase involved in cell wall biosynthesis
VVPLGIGALERAISLPEHDVRAQFGLGDRSVLLSLSAKREHKNLGALLEALAALPSRPILVLAGYPTPHERDLRLRAQALGIAEDVRWPGWLTPPELEGLWQLTSAFVFPSLYEGFGLPVLEAMARGVPVACSNASSLPEVAGDAALMFDPRDPRSIATALERLLEGGPEIEALKAAGVARARQFTWQRTASGTLASYARALQGDRPTRRYRLAA